MRLMLMDAERTALEAAQRSSRSVRHWRRYQAVLLRADGVPLATVTQTLDCTAASVCNWTRAWRERGTRGVAERPYRGATRRLDVAAERALEALLTEDKPSAHGHAATNWTTPLRRTELAKHGWQASERTVRPALHRLGYCCKRPKFVLGRPDPAYEEKKSRVGASSSHGGGRRGSLVRR